MLAELSVRNLGVIEDLTLLLGPGMTVLTGETGAGKTLVVEAIDLLLGGRPDPVLVRPGAEEAVVSGRFVVGDGDELILTRIVPAVGRSRAYVDGRMASVAALTDAGSALVDLYGQNGQQSLLAPAVQRAALDRFGGSRLAELATMLADAQAVLRRIDRALEALGGDGRQRAREIDLLRFQVDELDTAALEDPDEEAALAVEEDSLADATAHREAAAASYDHLLGDGATRDRLGSALAALAGRAPFAELSERLRSAAAEIDDTAGELRDAAETLADDPARLAEVRARRQLLRDLQRKYGDSLAEVLKYREEARGRLTDLESYEVRAAALESDRTQAVTEVATAAAALGAARRVAAPDLSAAIEANLSSLALPRARFAVRVGELDPGDDVMFALGANTGEPVLPLAKVASGGELARTMLAARLVLSGGPPTLVFDEVDAGVGGEAAVAVGRSLASVARGSVGSDRQVLVVTHLAQVAAFADAQIAVHKSEVDGRTVAQARRLSPDDRVVELSRMLSGRPDSRSARQHATELLAAASAEKAEERVRSGADAPAGVGRRGRRSPLRPSS